MACIPLLDTKSKATRDVSQSKIYQTGTRRPALQKGETYDTPDDEHTPGNSFLHRSLCYITLYPIFIIVSVKLP